MQFLHPTNLECLTAADSWHKQFFSGNIQLGESGQFDFKKRLHGGNNAIFHAFNGKVIFNSLVTRQLTKDHTRYGLSFKDSSMRLEFPIELPQDIHIGVLIFKKTGQESYFILLVAQDTKNPMNCTVHWGDRLEGDFADIFAGLNNSFVDKNSFHRMS